MQLKKPRKDCVSSLNNQAEAFVGITAEFKENQRYDIHYAVENNTNEEAQFYVEIYGMEDSLIGSQAGADPFHLPHYRVNRGGFYGEMGKEINLAPGEAVEDGFEYVPCWGCIPEDVYFNIVVWKKLPSGKYEYVNGKELK